MDPPFNMYVPLNMKIHAFYDSADTFNVENAQLLLPYTVLTTGKPKCAPPDVRALASSSKSNNIPAAFIQVGTSGYMNVFFQLDKVEPQMGRPDNDCVGQILVQYRELIGQNQATVVSRPDNVFNIVAVVRVHFPATIAIILIGDPDVSLICPWDEGDAALEVVCGHIITVVSPPFVSSLLDQNKCAAVDT